MTARVYNNILLQLDLIENKIQSGHVSNNPGYNMIQGKSPWNRAQIDNLQSTALMRTCGFRIVKRDQRSWIERKTIEGDQRRINEMIDYESVPRIKILSSTRRQPRDNRSNAKIIRFNEPHSIMLNDENRQVWKIILKQFTRTIHLLK